MFAVNKSIIIIHFHKLQNLQEGTNDLELAIAEFFFVEKWFLATNLILLESRIISLLNRATFLRNLHLWDEQ